MLPVTGRIVRPDVARGRGIVRTVTAVSGGRFVTGIVRVRGDRRWLTGVLDVVLAMVIDGGRRFAFKLRGRRGMVIVRVKVFVHRELVHGRYCVRAQTDPAAAARLYPVAARV